MLLTGIVANVAMDTENMATERAMGITRIRFGIEQMMPEIGALKGANFRYGSQNFY